MKQLFKYTSMPVRILEDGYIRATQLCALNDPFEATYCSDGLNKLTAHFEGFAPSEIEDYVERFKHHVGVICLSEVKDSLLMWSHYADEHRGALVGLFVDHPHLGIFANLLPFQGTMWASEDGHGVFSGKCLPVKYRRQPRYRVDRYDFDYSEFFAQGCDRFLFEIFQQKSEEWIYEREHRITLRLEQADVVRIVDLEASRNGNLVSTIKGLDAYRLV